MLEVLWKYGPNILSILGAVLSASGTLWKSLADATAKEDSSKRVSRASIYVVYVGAILVVTGTLWNFQAQLRSSEEQKSLQAQLLSKATEGLGLSRQLTGKTQEIADLYKELSHKSDELARMSREVRYSVMGHGFCYVLPTSPLPNAGWFSVLVLNDSTYPLYDVGVRIASNKPPKEPVTLQSFFNSQIQFNLPSIPGKMGTIRSEQIPIPLGESIGFNIFITTRSATFTELLRFRRVGNQWAMAMRLLAENGRTILKETVDPTFPKNEKGEIVWE